LAWADDAPKKLSSMDLAVETRKWDGRLIQTAGQCFYADKDEYRRAIQPVRGTEMVRIDFSAIEPDAMKKVIEDNCDTIEKMTTRACAVNIVFTYESNSLREDANGTSTMFILATDNKGVFSKAK
jgi:hypothetical protein